jgi:cell division protein FtsN
MSKNYAKLPPRPEQRYRRNSNASKSGYFILLLLVIIGITGYYVFSRGIFFSKNSNEINQQPSKTQETKPQPAKPRFEFYTVLSKETVPVSQNRNTANQSVTADATTSEEEATLEAAKAKEEAENAAAVQTEDNTAQPATLEMAPSGVPAIPIQTKHSRTNPSNTTTQAEAKTVTTQPVKPKPVSTPVTSIQPTINTTKSNRYILQVAALQHMSDVDQLKAKLSFLGFDVLVEPFQRGGVVWYRIKVGPYLSPESMQKARQVLSSNGLGSIIITLPSAK